MDGPPLTLARCSRSTSQLDSNSHSPRRLLLVPSPSLAEERWTSARTCRRAGCDSGEGGAGACHPIDLVLEPPNIAPHCLQLRFVHGPSPHRLHYWELLSPWPYRGLGTASSPHTLSSPLCASLTTLDPLRSSSPLFQYRASGPSYGHLDCPTHPNHPICTADPSALSGPLARKGCHAVSAASRGGAGRGSAGRAWSARGRRRGE